MDNTNKNMINNRNLINNGYYFESLVLNAIDKKLEEENKLLLNKYVKVDNFYEFDAIIPEGIDGLEGQTVVDVKLYRDKRNYFLSIKKISERLKRGLEYHVSPVKSILFIFGSTFTGKEKTDLEKRFAEIINYPIKVWGLDELCKIDDKFNYLKDGDFSKIAEFVVNDVVAGALNKNNDSWKKIRDDRINQLKEIYKRDELVLFLGAGVSKDAGISDWNDLISDLLILMIKNTLEKKDIKVSQQETDFLLSKMKEINDASPLLQAAFIKAALGESFEENISNLLYKNINNNNGTSQLLSSISKLCVPKRNGVGVQAVVTYNFDDLLEDNFNKYHIEYNSLYSEFEYTTSDKLGIYHVHGFLPRNPDKYEQLSEGLLVFSEEGYHSLYNDPYSWANITQLNFLRENTTLMIGLSLTDPNLRRLLSISNRKNKLKKHYAIMKKDDIKTSSDGIEIKNDILKSFNIINNDLQEKFFEQLGINIIWIESYEEIPSIIESIRTV
ncbi:hypothetical protein AXY43_03965 [Clostridium sp. MF28]|uniref:SIR2 family protein n=1 Tax=Clostridium TaxID=1485 RepID=UPI000CFA768F|nr:MULTISPECIES: SIR2 family protein [Clostridium]AVK47243.1 hypothetical protein AXY43_03965 [Clostridium sp. MF28]PSM56638.1 hypothetical protein C4L39_16640 [Clostridium diolis]